MNNFQLLHSNFFGIKLSGWFTCLNSLTSWLFNWVSWFIIWFGWRLVIPLIVFEFLFVLLKTFELLNKNILLSFFEQFYAFSCSLIIILEFIWLCSGLGLFWNSCYSKSCCCRSSYCVCYESLPKGFWFLLWVYVSVFTPFILFIWLN